MVNKKQIKNNDIIDIFQYVFQYFQRYNIDDETKKLADDLLRIAKEDLEVCELLYNNEKYPYAIEKLHQSVEKASKAYALYFGNFSKKEIRKISHNSVDAFVMLLDKMGGYTDIVKNMYPDIKTDTSDLKSLIKDDKKRMELAKADYKTFEVIFTMFEDIKDSLTEKLSDILTIIEDFSLQDLLKESLQDCVENISEYVDGKDNQEIINQFSGIDGIKSYILNSLDFIMLYTIAGFTFPHFQYIRYPDGDMKPFDYTKELGIVKATPELITHLKRIYHTIHCCFNQ